MAPDVGLGRDRAPLIFLRESPGGGAPTARHHTRRRATSHSFLERRPAWRVQNGRARSRAPPQGAPMMPRLRLASLTFALVIAAAGCGSITLTPDGAGGAAGSTSTGAAGTGASGTAGG